VFPGIVDIARHSGYFLARAVRFLADDAGIRQFLDVGTGLPTVDNTHEVAERVAPECKIAYVDNDPLVLVHARALNGPPYWPWPGTRTRRTGGTPTATCRGHPVAFPGDQIPGVVYLEQLTTAIYPRSPEYLLYHWNVLNRVATEAETPATTIASLRRMHNQVRPRSAPVVER